MKLYCVASFYKFINLNNLSQLQTALFKICQENAILGSILLAPEGINGNIVGEPNRVQATIESIQREMNLEFNCKYANSDTVPFNKLKILLKKEIITMGVEGIQPNKKTGIPVNPEAWNDLIQDPEVFVLDTRNHYEVALGSFKGSHNPNTDTFGEFPNYVKENLNPEKHKKIAMFCTGGIRCEKASAYLLSQGFDTVFQLDGGILKYLSQTDADHSLWQGHCFVFDERISVG